MDKQTDRPWGSERSKNDEIVDALTQILGCQPNEIVNVVSNLKAGHTAMLAIADQFGL